MARETEESYAELTILMKLGRDGLVEGKRVPLPGS